MAITIEREPGLGSDADQTVALECPYCGVFAHMSPQSVPDFGSVTASKPKHVGLVHQCNACSAPVFLRFAVKQYTNDQVELYQNFSELERPKERFSFSYLPNDVEVLFREALSCYSNNNFNAFASMCRRTAVAAFAALGSNGKFSSFDDVMAAKEIAGIDDDRFDSIKSVIFDTSNEDQLPLLDNGQAGVLLEVLKDMLYQRFVRSGKLARAIKVRRFFVKDGSGGLDPSA